MAHINAEVGGVVPSLNFARLECRLAGAVGVACRLGAWPVHWNLNLERHSGYFGVSRCFVFEYPVPHFSEISFRFALQLERRGEAGQADSSIKNQRLFHLLELQTELRH